MKIGFSCPVEQHTTELFTMRHLISLENNLVLQIKVPL